MDGSYPSIEWSVTISRYKNQRDEGGHVGSNPTVDLVYGGSSLLVKRLTVNQENRVRSPVSPKLKLLWKKMLKHC